MPATRENSVDVDDTYFNFHFQPLLYLEFLYDSILLAFLTMRILVEKLFAFLFPPNPKSLQGEIILVTGGANGIGREICVKLVKIERRLTIISWDIDEESNKILVKDLQALGVMQAFGFKVNVSDREQVRLEAIRIRQQIGEVTMLFNNAGIPGELKEGWKMSSKSIQSVIQVNLLSHCWTLQEFLPQMISMRKGHVIETCSVLAFAWGKYGSPYVASKHGLKAYVESIKEDLRSLPVKSRIAFTIAYPHNTLTNLTARANLVARKYPFLLPQLKPDHVAAQIVEGMLLNEEYVFIPAYYRLVVMILALLPAEVIRRITDLPKIESGSNPNLTHFIQSSAVESDSDSSEDSFLSVD